MSFWGKNARTSRDAGRPPGMSEVNKSVWKLYEPVDRAPDVDIIFFHGLQKGDYEDAFWKTWVAMTDDQLVWPKDWLSKKFPDARILSVSYNSCATLLEGATGQGDMERVGRNLVEDIVVRTDHNIGQNCPVFLVGHCLGGIVIKQFVLSVIDKREQLKPKDDQRDNDQKKIDRIDTFLKNVKGAFFYGTPNGGIRDHNIKALVDRLSSPSPILQLLKVLDAETGRINNEFRQQRKNRLDIQTFGLAEGCKTNHSGFHGLVVPAASSHRDVNTYYTNETADHFTVCKAETKVDPTVIGFLSSFIIDAVPAIKFNTQDAIQEAELLL